MSPMSYTMASLLEICESDHQACLAELPRAFKNSEKGSSNWYRLELYRIDAYYGLINTAELGKALDNLESEPNLPPKLQLKLYIYRAKLAGYKGQTTDVALYRQKATNFLESLKDNIKSPDMIIDYANFQLNTKQYQHGIDNLLPLEKAFRHHKNSRIKYRIYTNLGNLYVYIGDLETSLDNFQLAYENAQLHGHEYNQTMALYNVARGLQKLGRLTQAKLKFIQILSRAKQNNDNVHASLSNYRVGEILVIEQKYSEAQQYLQNVETSILSEGQKAHLEELKSKS